MSDHDKYTESTQPIPRLDDTSESEAGLPITNEVSFAGIEVEGVLKGISHLTGSCAYLFLAFRDEGRALQIHPLAHSARYLSSAYQPLCRRIQQINALPHTPLCSAQAKNAVRETIEAIEGDRDPPNSCNCPAAQRALLVEVVETGHGHLWAVVVAGLIHPADVFTTDVLSRELDIDESEVGRLASTVPPLHSYRSLPAEAMVRQLANTAANLAARILDNQPDHVAPNTGRASSEAIFEQLALRERLRVLEEQIERRKLQTASMVHDMRTPLSAILGHIDLFNMGVYGQVSSGQREALDTMRDRASRLLGLIKDILDHARLEGGVIPLTPSPYPLKTTLNRALSHVQTAAEHKGLTTRIEFLDHTDTLTPYGSEQRTEQVVTNLLSNAVKFTDVGSVIVIVRAYGSDMFQITVRDTGAGIPASDIEVIFEPYQRARRDARRTGVGLGLAICRAFVEQMGGSLTVESTYGEGSDFNVRLPIRVTDRR
ncbi:MAG: HAMP domain-containing sensor histidine kinase [Myxococcota bacterium]